MIRKLLACLAFLTGLAAAGVPAQAEMAVALASRSEASATVDTVSIGAVAVATCAFPRGSKAAVPVARVAISAHPALSPAVRLRSDRARE